MLTQVALRCANRSRDRDPLSFDEPFTGGETSVERCFDRLAQ